MSFNFDIENDILIVKINEQRATVEISSKLKEELLEKIEEGNQNILVDLSSSDFVDSSFLGALVAGLKKATMKSGDLKIVGLQAPVRAMFELTRLYRIFDIFDTMEEAKNSFT
ncbi:MAG: anti-sigma factor antagonist [Calditrichaeota bacterium]|nr:MAG: anti-sigma factor antagonist [Calditrichota bacterium]MBL1204482.1 anti-sigma factor antagonist [Calditrichota bacterium]NOG44311.1 STAS domain-containing protein [Calditrichota bacterium]